jgi:hypothetical protein
MLILALPIVGMSAFACGGGNDNMPPPPPPPPVPATDAATTVATVTPTASPAAKPPAPPVTLTPGAASPDPTPPPTVAITSPAKDQVVANDKAADFSIKLDVKNWQTATGSNHVHLILDNKPYKPIYDTKAPVKLSELTGGEAVAEGLHVLVAFPSRANHESVKTKGALSIVPFWVGKKGDAATVAFTKKPMLIYSRPKGDYKGEMANHVLIDFYLANETLAEGKDHVAVSVSGPGIDKPLEGKVDKWGTPLYLDNLQNGAYEVKTTLLDGSDKPIEGPWNATTRTIKVDRDAPTDVPAAHGDHGSAAPAADAGAAKPGAKPAGKPAPAATPPPTMTNQYPAMSPH